MQKLAFLDEYSSKFSGKKIWKPKEGTKINRKGLVYQIIIFIMIQTYFF